MDKETLKKIAALVNKNVVEMQPDDGWEGLKWHLSYLAWRPMPKDRWKGVHIKDTVAGKTRTVPLEYRWEHWGFTELVLPFTAGIKAVTPNLSFKERMRRALVFVEGRAAAQRRSAYLRWKGKVEMPAMGKNQPAYVANLLPYIIRDNKDLDDKYKYHPEKDTYYVANGDIRVLIGTEKIENADTPKDLQLVFGNQLKKAPTVDSVHWTKASRINYQNQRRRSGMIARNSHGVYVFISEDEWSW